ncbi:hypothetical protein NM688_g197 [Phlebia brevispora]|uniref:Uncharacterized protein n=1 Tax=Phlebia brevispora TaxID=194682 RepID=A0ACC1TF19_9APHY|nr:hypothetical protein NM688_g197 [Phlebia brevispora]
MSSNIVLPTLSKWAEQHLTNLFQATDEKSFDQAYSNFFTHNPKIVVNGQHLTSDQYKKQLWSGKGLESGAQVIFTGAVEVPIDANKPFDAGNVGLFLNATVDEKFLVLGAPESYTVTASYNLTIIQDPSLKHPTGPIRTPFDGRRVSSISKVSVDKRNPILPISVPPLEPVN